MLSFSLQVMLHTTTDLSFSLETYLCLIHRIFASSTSLSILSEVAVTCPAGQCLSVRANTCVHSSLQTVNWEIMNVSACLDMAKISILLTELRWHPVYPCITHIFWLKGRKMAAKDWSQFSSCLHSTTCTKCKHCHWYCPLWPMCRRMMQFFLRFTTTSLNNSKLIMNILCLTKVLSYKT